jgi:L-malate glycosyltransferase
MRIGIACYPTYGGSGVVACELGLELAKRGHEVHVISYILPARLAGYTERVFYHEIEMVAYPLFRYPPWPLAAACKMIEVAEANALEILHVHYAVPWAVCAHLAREVIAENGLRPKIVTTLHGTDITLVGNEPSFFKMTRFGIQRSDAVTAVSNYLRETTLDTFGVTCPIDVIHNFVDAERFKPRADVREQGRKAWAPEGEPLMAHVSNFRPVKNIPDVLRTFAFLREKLKCRLLMVGEGPELPAARELARELRIQKDVLFLGKQQAVEGILACADLFILPSAYESFGLSALEAMSCGLPVIATETGGLAEVIEPGVEGWLCRVGDCRCMAERAGQLLGDGGKARAFGGAARRKAVERFSPERIVPQYEAVYRRALGT